MRLRAGWAFCLGLAACEELTIVAYDADDGVLPIWYEDTFTSLPTSFARTEWPDGAVLMETPTGPVRLLVGTRPDGSRDVTLARDVQLIDAAGSSFLLGFLGAEAIRSIRAIALSLVDLRLDDVDRAAGPAELRAASTLIPGDGSPGIMPGPVVERLRAALLSGAGITVPVGLRFQLAEDALDALPPGQLHVFIMVQPTLYVDVLDAL